MFSYAYEDAGRLLVGALFAMACFVPFPPLSQNAEIALRVLFQQPSPGLTYGARR